MIYQNYENSYDPISAPHYTEIDSFDTHDLIRSSYSVFTDSLLQPRYRTYYKYSPADKIIYQLSEYAYHSNWHKNVENITEYDNLDRISNFSSNYFTYDPSSSSLDSARNYYGRTMHYEYTPQNLQGLIESRDFSNSLPTSGGRWTFVYDSFGRLASTKREDWQAQSGYTLYKIERNEYYSNDSLKCQYIDSYTNNLISYGSKYEYFYSSAGDLLKVEKSNLILGTSNYHLNTINNYFYDTLHRRIRIDIGGYDKLIYVFNPNGKLSWYAHYEYEPFDSVWYQFGDSVSFIYNTNNQLTHTYRYSGGGDHSENYSYDSSGFMNYTDFNYSTSMSEGGSGKSYISYKKLLHTDAIPDENSFTLFPNPNDGNFNLIYFSSMDEPITIKVHNALGQVVFQETENKTAGYFRMSFNLAKISNGIYFLEFTSTSKRTTKKFLVE